MHVLRDEISLRCHAKNCSFENRGALGRKVRIPQKWAQSTPLGWIYPEKNVPGDFEPNRLS